MKDNNAKMYGFCIFVFYQYPQAVKMLVLVCLGIKIILTLEGMIEAKA